MAFLIARLLPLLLVVLAGILLAVRVRRAFRRFGGAFAAATGAGIACPACGCPAPAAAGKAWTCPRCGERLALGDDGRVRIRVSEEEMRS